MLTATQIEVVRSVITNNDDVYEDTARTVLDLAAAYLRVVALRSCYAQTDPNMRFTAAAIVAEIDRALEG
jgi:hypothetical protein